MAFGHPPHNEMHLAQNFKPFLPAFVEFLVHCPPDKAFKAFDILPDGQVGHKLRVTFKLGFGIAGAGFAGTFHHPDKARHPLAKAVDAIKIIHEFLHTRVIGRCDETPDIEFSQMHGHEWSSPSVRVTSLPPDALSDYPSSAPAAPK